MNKNIDSIALTNFFKNYRKNMWMNYIVVIAKNLWGQYVCLMSYLKLLNVNSAIANFPQ